MKKYIYLVVSCILLISCKTVTEYADYSNTIHVDSICETVQIDSIIESFEYIKLETNDDCCIGDVEQMLVKDGNIYILSSGVHCFKHDGTHVFSLNKKGHAKSEFVRIGSISFYKNHLCVYDNAQFKIMLFDLKDGKFIDSKSLPMGAYHVYGADDKLIVESINVHEKTNGIKRFQIYDWDDFNEFQFECVSKDETLEFFGTNSVNNNGLIYSDVLRNVAWAIGNNNTTPYFELIFPRDKVFSEEEVKNRLKNKDYSIVDKISGLTYVFENNNHIIGALANGTKPVSFIYNKINDKVTAFSDVKRELWQYVPWHFNASDENSFYAVMPYEYVKMVKQFINSNNNPADPKMKENYDKFNSLKDGDNPIIVRYVVR